MIFFPVFYRLCHNKISKFDSVFIGFPLPFHLKSVSLCFSRHLKVFFFFVFEMTELANIKGISLDRSARVRMVGTCAIIADHEDKHVTGRVLPQSLSSSPFLLFSSVPAVQTKTQSTSSFNVGTKETYYGQHMQDEYLEKEIFKRKRDGFYIEIGAADGLAISNTRFFMESRGWCGILVEPHPDFFAQCVKNRPKDKCYELCCLNEKKTVQFRVNSGYTEMLSGVEDAYQVKHKDRISQEIEQRGGSTKLIDRDAVTLNEILSKDFPVVKKIDFISIDCEGSELEVLQGIDFTKYDIDVLMVEINYYDQKAVDLESLLLKNGYKRFHYIYQDCFYRKS